MLVCCILLPPSPTQSYVTISSLSVMIFQVGNARTSCLSLQPTGMKTNIMKSLLDAAVLSRCNESIFYRADDLDAAVLDRCDESIFFPLPNAECRKDLILLYFNLHFRKCVDTNNERARSLRSQITNYLMNQKPLIMSIESDLMAGEQLESTIAVTHGFSGREIGKLMVTIFLESS